MGEKPQVLVVDDDLAVCGMLRSFLDARGYNAITATSADEAVRRFHGDRPDAVLLDVVIPGSMDGLGALAAFKKIDQDVPVIVISGQGHANTVVQAMKLGASDFVCKPFEDDELEMLLANVHEAAAAEPGGRHPARAAEGAVALHDALRRQRAHG